MTGSERGRRPGFTIIELMVALVVVGLIALAAHAAVATASGAVQRLDRATGPVRRGTAVRITLRQWLRAIAPVGSLPVLTGTDGGSGPLALDRIQFTVRDGGRLRPGPHRIGIRIDADPGTAVQGLIIRIEDLSAATARPAEILEAAPAATGVSIRYRTWVDGRVRWRDHWNARDGRPEAIQLRIFEPTRPSDSVFHALLTRPIHVRLTTLAP